MKYSPTTTALIKMALQGTILFECWDFSGAPRSETLSAVSCGYGLEMYRTTAADEGTKQWSALLPIYVQSAPLEWRRGHYPHAY
jgi:hypothetical protein